MSIAPYLVADIGGTHVRFGLVREARRISDMVSLRCADYDGPAEAALAYLEGLGLTPGAQGTQGTQGTQGKIAQAAFAVATAVNGDAFKLTNSDWSFNRQGVARALGINRLQVVNDFEALASSLPALGSADLIAVGAARQLPGLPMAVIGPGTGLGVASLIPSGQGWIALAGEGGHATLAAMDDFEAEILRAARREFPHVSAERLLSGIGLKLLLRAVCDVEGVAAPDLPSEEIGTLGVSDRQPQCRATMDLFFSFLGNFAGNVALTVGARGGLFIGGGIVPRMPDFLMQSRFRERFESKGRFQPYLAAISTALITAPYASLQGLTRVVEEGQ